MNLNLLLKEFIWKTRNEIFKVIGNLQKNLENEKEPS